MKNGEKPAMPIRNDLCPDEKPHWVDGMTKREYFAGLAMQGLCANGIPGSHNKPENLSVEAVAHADALLAELDK